ncbi:MAG: CBS domain-containing protein, partial [Actinomycetota bacterium]
MTTVRQIMTTELVTVDPSITLIEAARAMSAGHAGSVLVVQHGSLVGIFTERDMLRAMAQSSKADAIERYGATLCTGIHTVQAGQCTEAVPAVASWPSPGESRSATQHAESNSGHPSVLLLFAGDIHLRVISAPISRPISAAFHRLRCADRLLPVLRAGDVHSPTWRSQYLVSVDRAAS